MPCMLLFDIAGLGVVPTPFLETALASSIDRQWWGQGIGRAAIEAMVGILRGYGFTTLLIRPSARNARAVATYRRAGFVEQSNTSGPLPEWVYAPEDWDYRDSLVMVRQLTS